MRRGSTAAIASMSIVGSATDWPFVFYENRLTGEVFGPISQVPFWYYKSYLVGGRRPASGYRRISRRPQFAENKRHLVALDQPPCVLPRFRRTIGIIIGDIVDLAPVDAAALVDRLHIGHDGLADLADR